MPSFSKHALTVSWHGPMMNRRAKVPEAESGGTFYLTFLLQWP